MHLDDLGLKQLWDQISSLFARKRQALGSLSYDSDSRTLSWFAVTGGFLNSLSLSSLAKKTEAAHSLSADRQNKALVLKDVTGNNTLSTVRLSDILSDSTSGLVSAADAIGDITISGKDLKIWKANGDLKRTITLP